MMDRVTKSFLKEFSSSFGFEHISDETLLFEHFVNYTIIEPKTEYRFEIEKINIGTNGTIGIDGFALLLNKHFIDTEDELDEFLEQHKKCTAEVIFIQSKTSSRFDTKEIGNFGFSVGDFVGEKQTLKWSYNGLERIKLFNKFVLRISELKENPICSLFYVTLGTNKNDQNVFARTDDIKKDIEAENLFSQIKFELVDAANIQQKYKKIGQVVERSFEFPQRVTMPLIKSVKEAYIGVVDAKTIVQLMTEESGDIRSNVFYDNVRDFQGQNRVNSEIASTIKSSNKDAFSILNNGITIVAEELRTTRDTFTISNYQIINGCQTSHVLFENREELDSCISVPLKLVVTNDEDLTSKVIRSTNRQTEVKEQDLIAFSNFQKRLEDYYKTFNGNESLYYERRSKQYNNKNIERKRIIDKTTQIKAIASVYFNKPELATRYFGTLFNEFGDKLFEDGHEMFPYYVAAYSVYALESLFRQNKIDKNYRKIKYHMLTMIRNEINTTDCPNFNSKKSVEYAEKIHNVFKDTKKLENYVDKIINKISKLDFDINNNEISKSKEFVKTVLAIYR